MSKRQIKTQTDMHKCIADALNNNDIELFNNSFIHFPYNFTFSFEDDHPINLSGINDHYLRFWINDDEKNKIIQEMVKTKATGHGLFAGFEGDELSTQIKRFTKIILKEGGFFGDVLKRDTDFSSLFFATIHDKLGHACVFKPFRGS